ncbi:MAG: hypothetical protein RLZZ623_2390, partial [Actinomycetota bacterium]
MPQLVDPTDREWGAFTEEAPWSLHRDDIRWLPLAEHLRRTARAEVPVLTKPTRVPPGTRVITVVSVLGRAVLPWLVRKRRGRYATPEAS